MSNWMLLTVSALYFATGVIKWWEGSIWWFIFWSCYAMANVAWVRATL